MYKASRQNVGGGCSKTTTLNNNYLLKVFHWSKLPQMWWVVDNDDDDVEIGARGTNAGNHLQGRGASPLLSCNLLLQCSRDVNCNAVNFNFVQFWAKQATLCFLHSNGSSSFYYQQNVLECLVAICLESNCAIADCNILPQNKGWIFSNQCSV